MLYRALALSGRFVGITRNEVPLEFDAEAFAVNTSDSPILTPWSGSHFAENGIAPILSGLAIGNAFPCCPTDDGIHFRAPKPSEIGNPVNLERIRSEIIRATQSNGGVPSRIITMGGAARKAIQLALKGIDEQEIEVFAIHHPSRQGLLSAAPERGKGARMADLERQWVDKMAEMVR